MLGSRVEECGTTSWRGWRVCKRGNSVVQPVSCDQFEEFNLRGLMGDTCGAGGPSKGTSFHLARQTGHTRFPCLTLDAMQGKWKV